MILAAGFGKRIHPLTHKLPKPLLKIGNETLLSNTLKFLEFFGIKEVVINVHYLGEQIIHYIQNNKFFIFYRVYPNNNPFIYKKKIFNCCNHKIMKCFIARA